MTEFLLGGKGAINDSVELLGRLQIGFATRPNKEYFRNLIHQICRERSNMGYTSGQEKDMYLGRIAVAAFNIGDRLLFERSVKSVSVGFGEGAFFSLGELTCFRTLAVNKSE